MLGQLRKLDTKSKKYVHVGYAPNAYRLWDAEKRKIVIARDVKFARQSIKEETKQATIKVSLDIIEEKEKEENEELEDRNLMEEKEKKARNENSIQQEKGKERNGKITEEGEEESNEEETLKGQQGEKEVDTPRRSQREKKCSERYGD